MKRNRTKQNAPVQLESLEGRQMMAAGDLDLTFGNAGKVIAAETVGHPVSDVAVQADGKLVVVGTLNNKFAVTRFNADGTLDRSFGGGGFVRTDFAGAGADVANDVVVQPDGKIIVVGIHGDEPGRPDSVFAVARLNPNGSPDNTFSSDGKQTIDLGKPAGARAVVLQPDGKILVAGFGDSGRVNINDDFAVARLLPNGLLDESFGDGRLLSSKRTGKTRIDFDAHTQSEGATMIALAPNGKIIVAGLGGNFGGTNILKPAVARLNSNGTLDKSFGDGVIGDGKANNFAPLGVNLNALHVSPDGSLTLAGGNNGNFMTVRLTSVGRLDKSFGGAGRVETNLGGDDHAKHVFVNREGILVAGGSSGKFAMARFRLNGQLDPTFGQGGKVITAAGPNDAILTTKMTPDGKLLAYGRTASAARYITAVPKVNVFSLDPAGAEGRNNPASLIFTRDLRLSFPTRVFYNLGGTATVNVDYTGPKMTRIITSPAAAPAGSLVPVTLETAGFVDIPANETTVIVPITVIDDARVEQTETVLVSVRSNPAYTLGTRTTQQVSIRDNDRALGTLPNGGTVFSQLRI